jgi:hypothetical protein
MSEPAVDVKQARSRIVGAHGFSEKPSSVYSSGLAGDGRWRKSRGRLDRRLEQTHAPNRSVLVRTTLESAAVGDAWPLCGKKEDLQVP